MSGYAGERARRQQAVQQVLAQLESLVAQGGEASGGRLPPERELARRLATSRATLREVLRSLGVIDAAPRRGTRVVGVPSLPIRMVFPNLWRIANPEDVMQARIILEPGIASVAALRGSPSDWEALGECVQAGLAATTVEAFEHADREFHIRLARSTRNEALAYLSTLLQGIRDEVVWGELKRRALAQKDRMRVYVRDHEAVLEALKRRDPEQAFRCMQEHLERVHQHMLREAATGEQRPWREPFRRS